MPAAVLERPPAPPEPAPPAPHDAASSSSGAGHPPLRGGGGGGGGGRGPRGRSDQWSIPLAAFVTALIGALFTFLGILTQIWANMIGSQLPGA